MEEVMGVSRKIQITPAKSRWGVATPWTLLLHGDAKQAASLERLLSIYRDPVYAYYSAQRMSKSDAEDLTQQLLMDFFLVRASHKNALPVHGRFRNYLLSAARHALLDWKKHGRSLKRGGKVAHVSIEDAKIHRPAQRENPDEQYDQRWAIATWHAAYDLFRSRTSEQLVEAFELFYKPEDKVSQEEAARRLGISVAALNSRLYTARRRFFECIKDIVQTTLEDPSELDEELRYLHRLLERSGFF
jgi:RNA polymerase sigma-70 factor (ECF subfamily)